MSKKQENKTSKRQEHGGSLSVGKRRVKRPFNTRQSLHITLKSQHAVGTRSLLKHKKMIEGQLHKASKLFNVKVYEFAICGNHLHLLIKGPTRESIQNFFRVFAGHTAQRILKEFPLSPKAGGAPTQKQGKGKKPPCKKNQRKFWSYLTYSRVITWGREFKTVTKYIIKNTLEALNIIAYTPRTLRKNQQGRASG